jgi:hypothetical protein
MSKALVLSPARDFSSIARRTRSKPCLSGGPRGHGRSEAMHAVLMSKRPHIGRAAVGLAMKPPE